MSVLDTARGLRAVARSGLLTPTRPDRLLRAGLAARHYGATLATAVAAGAARYGDHPAVIDERGVVTYEGLDARTNSFAPGLSALGVRGGDVVGILCRNHRYFVEATGACSKLGAHSLYLNT